MNRSYLSLAAVAFALPIFLSVSAVRADESTPVAAAAAAVAAAPVNTLQGALFPYTYLDYALNGRVDKQGLVDYVALKGDKGLAYFVKALETASLDQFPTWEFPVEPGATDRDGKPAKPKIDRGPELVFWINAYNALVLKTLSDDYPVNSPDDIKGFATEKNYIVGGAKYSLNDIRDIVAKIEPRALFTLCDGTIGSPTLATQAYRYRNVYGSLDPRAAAFVNDERNISVLRINNQVTMSSYYDTLNGYFR
jgi:hypothetical protein